jgi:hypothetical protein
VSGFLINPYRFAPPNTHALSFDRASTQHLTLTTMGTFARTLQTSTFETWVKSSDTTNTMCLFGTFNDGVTVGLQVWLNADSSATLSAGKVYVFLRDGSGLVLSGGTTNAVGVTDGAWHHLAVTLNGGTNTIQVYVDGTSMAFTYSITGTPAGFSVDFGYPMVFAARNNRATIDMPFSGSLDDIRIWDGVRTAAQISNNRSVQLAGNESGLVGYWRLNDGSGTTAVDATANAYHGTLVNTPTWGSGVPFA